MYISHLPTMIVKKNVFFFYSQIRSNLFEMQRLFADVGIVDSFRWKVLSHPMFNVHPAPNNMCSNNVLS